MISAGIDIGSTTTKAVIFDGVKILASSVMPSGIAPGETAEKVLASALAEAGLVKDQISSIASTGYGRRLTDLSDRIVTEIKACAAGAVFMGTPDGRPQTVVDIGGQDTKVIQLGEDGQVSNFIMNDKCAAGTGRFLEVLAMKLEMSYADFVVAALASTVQIQMNSTCAVFAESEVISLLARGMKKSDIAAAAHTSISNRVGAMLRRLDAQNPPYLFVGGGALNSAMLKALEENIGVKIHSHGYAQKVIALGAAVIAQKKEKE
jgi:predicted CoA-substrate-specific enzyme activase